MNKLPIRLFAGLWLLLQCLVTHGAAIAMDKVVLQLRWDHQFQFAGYYCALWQGYYRDAGIEVELRSAVDGNTILSSITEVAEGRADFGIGAADLLVARDQGIPVVVLASIFQHSGAAFYSLPGTHLQDPADLTRLKVARKVNDLIDIELQALLRAEGIDPARVKPFPHQPGLAHLLSRQVDVIPGYTISLPITASLAQVTLEELRPINYGIDFYGDTLFTDTRLISSNPDLVERFTAASLKGWEYALNNAEATAEAIASRLTRGSIQSDTNKFNQLQAKGVMDLIHYPEVSIGNINPDRWQRMNTLLKGAGILRHDLDLDTFLFQPDRLRLAKERQRQGVLSYTLLVLTAIAVISAGWIATLRRAVRRATAELQQSRRDTKSQLANYSFLYNKTPAMLHSIDRESRIINVSDFWLEKMGYERHEVIGANSVNFLTPASRKYALATALPEFFRTGQARNVNYQFVRKNGEVMDVLLNAVLLSHDGSSPQYSLAVLVDISELRRAEQALKTSEERFQLAMDFAEDGLYDWNLVTNTIYYSPGWKRMLGYEDHELANDFSVWERLTDPEDVKQSWLMLSELLEKKRDQFAMEFRMRHKEGHWVDILSRAKVVFNEQGKGVRVVGTHVDVSRSKRAENALLREKQRAEQYLQLAGVMFIGLDLSGRVFLANRKACEILECTREQLYGADWFSSFLPPGDLEQIQAVFRELVEQQTIENRFENEVVAASGRRKRIAWHNIRLVDEHGAATGVLCSGEDVTELHATICRLSHQQQLLNLIIDSIPVLITVYDPTINVLQVNREFTRVLGWETEDLANIDLMAEVLPDPSHREQIRSFMEQATGEWREVKIRTRHGLTVESIWSNVKIEDGTLVGIGLDITEKKQNEEMLRQARKMEALGTLAGGIAHDFNNILSAILGFSRLLKDRFEPGSTEDEDITEVINAGTRAAELVAQILAFSRKKEVQRVPVELHLVIREALKLIRATIPATVSLEFSSSAKGEMVEADITQINQVLMNLCTNAAHAVEEAADPKIIITLDPITITDAPLQIDGLAAGNYLQLKVADNGCGIAPEHIERIFDPYFTTKEVGKGSGMGLSVVLGIVKAHDGAIGIASAPGQGTTITIRIPAVAHQELSPAAPERQLTGGSEHILVVDDELQLVTLATRTLTGLGYQVTSCTTGDEALATFRRNPDTYQLVLTDQTMPGMAGDMLTRELLAIRENLPVIIASGYSERLQYSDPGMLGAAAILAKPFTPQSLASTVRDVLDRRHDRMRANQ